VAIKRKTHLNLSGSHHTLDSDNIFVGGTSYITGALSASTNISAQGALFVQGETQLTGAVSLAGTLTTVGAVSSSGNVSTAGNLFVQGASQFTGSAFFAGNATLGDASSDVITVTGRLTASQGLSASTDISTQGALYVQGTSFHTGAAYFGNVVSASSGFQAGASSTFKALTVSGALNASQTISASGNISTAGNLLVQGTTQHTGSVFASGIISGSTGQFTYISGALSGSSNGNPILKAGSNITVNWRDATLQWEITGSSDGSPVGSDTQVQFNQNGSFAASSSFTHRSGTLGIRTISGSNDATFLSDAPYSIAKVLNIDSNVLVTQSLAVFDGTQSQQLGGGVILANGASLSVYSGSFGANSDFWFRRSDTANKIDVVFDGLINVRPLYVTMSTGNATGTVLSGGLLTADIDAASVGIVDFNVIAAASATDDYASWKFSVTTRKNQAGVFTILAATEIDTIYEGSNAQTWDVNVNNNGDICCTGSAGTVNWYSQVVKKMILSGGVGENVFDGIESTVVY